MKILAIIFGILAGLYILFQLLVRFAAKSLRIDINSPIPPDLNLNFDTPESALQSIEDAYRRRNMAAILACRDFDLEARFIVKRMPESDPKYPAMLAANSKLCKEHFLQLIGEHGVPEWNGVSVKIRKKEDLGSGMFVITEELTLPTGGTMEAMSFVGKGKNGKYKVLMPYSDAMRQAWVGGEPMPTLEF